MPRYFLEVSYKGSNYSGFQVQQNANTIQAEMEKALQVLHKGALSLTGSSRTDAGVHALQNYFHFDVEIPLDLTKESASGIRFIYQLNAILPPDIVVKNIVQVESEAHCRFDALSREYKYFIYQAKDPFLQDRAFYFPYPLNMNLLVEGADLIKRYTDFTSFSKRNTQAKTFICNIMECSWAWENGCLVFYVRANRFLRGMVRALVATMLKVGRGTITMAEFQKIIEDRDCTRAHFAAPSQGLFLIRVNYPDHYFAKV